MFVFFPGEQAGLANEDERCEYKNPQRQNGFAFHGASFVSHALPWTCLHALDEDRGPSVPAANKHAERGKCFPELRNKMRHAEKSETPRVQASSNRYRKRTAQLHMNP